MRESKRRAYTTVTFEELANALHFDDDTDIIRIETDDTEVATITFIHPKAPIILSGWQAARTDIVLDDPYSWCINKEHVLIHNFLAQPHIQEELEAYKGDSK